MYLYAVSTKLYIIGEDDGSYYENCKVTKK